MQKKCRGISLLEVILCIAVISSITIVAIRYFTVTTRNLRIERAIQQVQHITDISYRWLQAQKQNNFSGTPQGTPISTDILVNSNLLDREHDALDPWGGDIEITAGDDPSYVQITLKNIPQKACKNMKQQLKSINHLPMIKSCGDKTLTNFVGEF